MNPEDKEWLHKLYEENASTMYRVAVRRLGNPESARDVVQEAFLALVNKTDTVREHPNPAGWLMRALKYLLLQQMEAEQKRLDYERPLEQILSVATADAPQLPLHDLLPRGLSPQERELLIWYYEERLTYEEIAARLKIPVLTCRTRMYRARKHCLRLEEAEKIKLKSV